MKKVAFIGLGNIGSAVANCVLKSGIDLTIWNRTAAKMVFLAGAGARPARTPGEAVRAADVVLSSLADDESLLENLHGEHGILSGLKPGAIHVCLSTISPDCADELAAIHRRHGSFYVSGPVVGRLDAAASGQLITYLAGDAEAIREVTPICESYAQRIIAMPGRARDANSMKLCINYNVLAILELMGETYAFAEKCGLPTEYIRDFYQREAFAHPAFRMYAERIRARDFAGGGGFVMRAGLKDARLMLSTAEAFGVDLPIGRIAERKLSAGIAAGLSEADWSAYYEITRREAGLD